MVRSGSIINNKKIVENENISNCQPNNIEFNEWREYKINIYDVLLLKWQNCKKFRNKIDMICDGNRETIDIIF